MKRGWQRGWVCWLGVVFCGCATHREVDLSRLLRQLDQNAATNAPAYDGPDVPESPAAPLALDSSADVGTVPGGEITIQPDSLLQISVGEDPSLDGSYPVNEIGAVQLKYVGPVILYNKTETQAEEKIREVLRTRDFLKATVKVKMLRASYDRVQILGRVNRPGVITIGAGDTISLYEALVRAGGLLFTKDETKVQILRGGMTSPTPFAIAPEEYTLMQANGKPEIPAVYLRPNDIARVQWMDAKGLEGGAASSETAGFSESLKNILVLGEVARPGYYSFKMNEPCTMMRLVFKMGGLAPYANAKDVTVTRRAPDGSDEKIKVDVEHLVEDGSPDDDVPLQDGDRVKFPTRRIRLF